VSKDDAMSVLLQVINDIRKTGFTPESVAPDFYLGGDLGIDSREMLEIWYELEKRLGIYVEDLEKRDLYTLADVLKVLESKLGSRSAAASGA
jgi:acyl carrier protein